MTAGARVTAGRGRPVRQRRSACSPPGAAARRSSAPPGGDAAPPASPPERPVRGRAVRQHAVRRVARRSRTDDGADLLRGDRRDRRRRRPGRAASPPHVESPAPGAGRRPWSSCTASAWTWARSTSSARRCRARGAAGWSSTTSPGTAAPAGWTQGEYDAATRSATALRAVIDGDRAARAGGAGRPLDGRHDHHGARRAAPGAVRATRVAGVVLISTSAGRLGGVTFGLPEVLARFARAAAAAGQRRRPAHRRDDRPGPARPRPTWPGCSPAGTASARPRPSPALVSYVERMNSGPPPRRSPATCAPSTRHARYPALAALRDIRRCW